MSYESRLQSDRIRQARKRQRDINLGLAATGRLDIAIVGAIQRVLEKHYGGSLEQAIKADSDIALVAKEAIDLLRDQGYAADSDIQKDRLRQRMGDKARRKSPRYD